jgi:hypothetical protein
LTVAGSGNKPGVDKWPGIVTPVMLGDVVTTAEADGGVVVILGGQWEHGNASGGRVDADNIARHVRETGLFEGGRVP